MYTCKQICLCLLILLVLLALPLLLTESLNIKPVYFSALDSIASAILLVIAYLGLNTWKHQEATKTKITFLDELVNDVMRYVFLVGGCLYSYRVIKLRISNQYLIDYATLTQYLDKNGKDDIKKLIEELSGFEAFVSKIQSLLLKGEWLGLKRYNECKESCEYLVWIYKHLASFSTFIDVGGWPWENSQIKRTLEDFVNINTDDIENNMNINLEKFIKFTQNQYQLILYKC